MDMTQVLSHSEERHPFMPWLETTKIRELVSELAVKHHFDLECPGYVLWVRAPQGDIPGKDPTELHELPLGDLAICVTQEGYTLGLCTLQGAGFRVHYSRNWIPLRAFNDNGCPFRNLARANEQMYKLVSHYSESKRSLVVDFFGAEDVPIRV